MVQGGWKWLHLHGEKQLNGGARAADLDEGEIAPGPENKGRGLSLV